jgi:ATPase subunit of ABC transporter with duplicated ATPase domains
MIITSQIMVNFSGQPLFENVSVKFLPGNCYGLIGANGAGKSTFLKVLAGDLEPSSGSVEIGKGQRLSKLEQDQFKYDGHTVMDTVFMGHHKLYAVNHERNELYARSEFSEADGVRITELESEFAELGGYEAEADAGALLAGLGVPEEDHHRLMGELSGGFKVRVLLAQAMFGKPDILLLDEPTNNLDVQTIAWLEDYLSRLEALVIVVSHDRHFLNNVCTHVADIDFRQIRIYVGNYDFWYQASELMLKQRRDQQKKSKEKAEDLKAFILRFSSNASKAKQATSRRKLLDKLTMEEMPTSTRRYPHIAFKAARECGRSVLRTENLSASVGGEVLFKGLNLMVSRGDKIAFVGQDGRARTALFQILVGERQPDGGVFEWGSTITPAYFPKENEAFFDGLDLNLVEWLRQYAADQYEETVRSFLGRMLFSGDDVLKPAKVLSGGERVRCMLARMMQVSGNALIMDEPTNHLDLESITALNNGLKDFPEVILFASHDRELVNTVANRIIEITPNGVIDVISTFDEYLDSPSVQAERKRLYGAEAPLT